MKREIFNQGFATLVNGYAYAQDRVTPESQDIYWAMLKDVPDDVWLWGIRKCLADYKFFPSINEIGVACCGESEEITDPFAKLTPWIQSAKRKVTWQENLDRILKRPGLKLPAPSKEETKTILSSLRQEPPL